MFDQDRVKIGLVPTRRGVFKEEDALEQKIPIMEHLKGIKGDRVDFVDIDDIVKNGMLYDLNDIVKVEKKLKEEKVDAIFIPHCDFGTEEVVGKIGSVMKLPVLLWGARDIGPDDTGRRKRDTQCGLFASSKVLQRYGVKYSYIVNSEVNSSKFEEGFARFAGAVSVVKAFKTIRIAQVSTRPKPFMSVMCNEDELLNRFGVEIVPVSFMELMNKVNDLAQKGSPELSRTLEDIKSRIDCSMMKEDALKKVAALNILLMEAIKANDCTAAAIECWSLFPRALGIAPCFTISELTDKGVPVACETDIHGAITSLMVQAAGMGRSATFFADLTIRHPENDNAELLWHCGPFPYSLKAENSPAGMEFAMAQWEIKGGDVTVARFDSIEGKYTLFAGEAKGVKGPHTRGTYLWVEVDNWDKWEEKFIFGPYIHHVVGIHGKYARVLVESCKYIPGLQPDPIDQFGLSL